MSGSDVLEGECWWRGLCGLLIRLTFKRGVGLRMDHVLGWFSKTRMRGMESLELVVYSVWSAYYNLREDIELTETESRGTSGVEINNYYNSLLQS